MKRAWLLTCGAVLVLGTGCFQPSAPPASDAPPPRDTRLPEQDGRPRDSQYGPTRDTNKAELSFDTDKDRRFGEFVTKTAGEMVHKVAVGIERRGSLRVQIGQATEPEDVLPLTKSLVAGARKDFPGKPFTVSVYDPQGEAILKARYSVDEGVRYEVARDSNDADRRPRAGEPDRDEKTSPSASNRSGTTEKDRRFSEWAMEKAHRYLRYVQADLERRGRVWFGVTRDVEPRDVQDLTRSLLEGAQKEFPGRDLTAAVFDPEGERVGTATLSKNGKLQWSR